MRAKAPKKAGIKVSVADRQSAIPIDFRWLKGLVRHVLEAERITTAEISLALVDNATIHALNLRFLKHDYPTDVITFPLSDSHNKLVGEIVASAEYAVEQATHYDWTPLEELGLYAVHGTLHLCGYDDHDEPEATEMKHRQESLLKEYSALHAPGSTLPPPVEATTGDGPQQPAAADRPWTEPQEGQPS